MNQVIRSFVIVALTVMAVGFWSDPRSAAAQPAAGESAPSGTITGTVVETMNADVYTYVKVDDGSKTIWAAAPKVAVAVGDKVVVSEGIAMQDFHSKTLDRTFDVIYFASGIQVVGGAVGAAPFAAAHAASPNGMPPHGLTGSSSVTTTTVDLSNIKKADGGQTVAELFGKKTSLVGKEVVVRGRVVKFTPDVMGKNWMHIQDGSGSTGSNDLAVSSSTAAAVGKTVLVRGRLTADKDYGFGYRYDIIIEDAAVTVE